MKLPTVHRPTIAPIHSRVRSARQHFRDGRPEHLGDVGRKLRKDRGDGHPPAFGLAENLREGRREDEEGEERQQPKISEVAGVDEPVVVDARPPPA